MHHEKHYFWRSCLGMPGYARCRFSAHCSQPYPQGFGSDEDSGYRFAGLL